MRIIFIVPEANNRNLFRNNRLELLNISLHCCSFMDFGIFHGIRSIPERRDYRKIEGRNTEHRAPKGEELNVTENQFDEPMNWLELCMYYSYAHNTLTKICNCVQIIFGRKKNKALL